MATWITVSLIFWTLFLIIFSMSTWCCMRMAWQEAQHGVSQANFRWSTDPSWICGALPPKSMLFCLSVTTNMWMPPHSGIPAAFCPIPCPLPRHRPLRALVQHPRCAAPLSTPPSCSLHLTTAQKPQTVQTTSWRLTTCALSCHTVHPCV